MIVKMIEFKECQKPGYRIRTYENASANATIHIAIDFNTSGEKLTKNCVKKQKKVYIPIDASNLIVSEDRVNKIVSFLNKIESKSNLISVNIAGNGIYTMAEYDVNQQECDEFAYDLLNQVVCNPNLKNKIKFIRSGGQTGFDESGIKAADKLGIPSLVYAPKNWTFRNIKGVDITDEKEFKKRFYNN